MSSWIRLGDKMIPKTIHYCWFGRGEKSTEVLQYIATWKRIMPDYEIIEWNEDNFDVNRCRFAVEAYDHKAYAFVSDYARMVILDSVGGIYLDVDMEVLKPMDTCLWHRCFFGLEGERGGIATCVIGAEPGTEIIRTIREHYESIPFVNPDGSVNNRPNTLVVEDLVKRVYGIGEIHHQGQIGEVFFYDWHVFHPKSLVSGKLFVNEQTIAVHHHTLLWVSTRTKLIKLLRQRVFIPLFGESAYWKIERKRKR